MPETNRPLKVFLCHASSDAAVVRALYHRLVKDGVDAWLDKESLLPGQNWELEIRKAVRNADIVVVCLSKQFNQAGYRQKEVRFALETAMVQPEGEIFIIPARLEECENLESLSSWHWVDLFEENGYEKLMRAFRIRAERIGATVNHVKIDDIVTGSMRMPDTHGRMPEKTTSTPVEEKPHAGASTPPRKARLPKVFISYSHADEKYKDELITMLRPLQAQKLLEIWQDREIQPGEEWFQSIKNSMNTCDLALLLISADFLASAFIQEEEIPALIQRRLKDGLRVVPIIIRPCMWHSVPVLAELQALPRNAKPIVSFRGAAARDKVWTEVALAVENICKRLVSEVPVRKDSESTGNVSDAKRFETPSPASSVQISVAQSFPAPGSRAEGIAWDGASLRVSDNSGMIFQVNPAGKVLDSVRSPDVTPQGLAWDGSSLWVFTSNRSLIYQIRQWEGENIQTVSSFRSPAQVLGGGITQDMAWDGEHLWYANQFKVYRLETSGKVLNSFTFHKNVTGLGWDGSNLWLAYNDFPQKTALSVVDTRGEILETYVGPILEINGLAWADGSLWALGSDSAGAKPMIYKLNMPAR